jgi:hypothetical protein
MAGWLLDDLGRLGGEGRAEEIRVERADGTLEPDVEKVAQVGVGHGIVIGWIGDDGIKVPVRVG